MYTVLHLLLTNMSCKWDGKSLICLNRGCNCRHAHINTHTLHILYMTTEYFPDNVNMKTKLTWFYQNKSITKLWDFLFITVTVFTPFQTKCLETYPCFTTQPRLIHQNFSENASSTVTLSTNDFIAFSKIYVSPPPSGYNTPKSPHPPRAIIRLIPQWFSAPSVRWLAASDVTPYSARSQSSS